MYILSGWMSTQESIERLELLQGTLDLLILRTLTFGRQHGQGVARAASNNRKARFYSLTAAGRKQLVKVADKWKRLTGAIVRILGPEEAKG
jgi:PadR family transcriptional regulator, regulatory protein PadR